VCFGLGLFVAQRGAADERGASVEARASRAPRAAIEHGERIAPFFHKLAQLEAQEQPSRGLVRVVHFGDSALVADGPTRVVRERLAARFGDGGPGFVLLGKPWRTYARACMETSAEGSVRVERLPRRRLEDGRYGLGGAALIVDALGTRLSLRSLPTGCSATFSRIELFYDRAPGYGSIAVRIDGDERARLPTAASAPESGSLVFDLADAPHTLEVEAVGDGPARLYGAALERSGPGVVYEVHGVVGGHARDYARTADETQWVDHLRRRAPDLVVVQLGTNETEDDPYHTGELRRMLVVMLERARRAAPEASCLVLTPYDRAPKRRARAQGQSHPHIAQAVREARAAADAAGCALFDTYQAMGGEGSMRRWARAKPARGAWDRTHLTLEGARVVGEMFADALLEAYERSVARQR
jgi:lysophospholipase L1-like esterase